MNNSPCAKQPMQFINCCQVMDCIDVKSTDNSITVEKSECGLDLKFTGNNLDQILEIKHGECIQMVKEFVNGKLVITPVIDMDCLAASVCDICSTPAEPVCPAPIQLSVTVAA